MTKEQYLEVRHDELQLLYHHAAQSIKIPQMMFVQLVIHWQRLMIMGEKMMFKKFKINYTPSQAYEMLVNYYDRKFELQLLYDQEGKLIKIIT
jgi:hypothetical protein